MAMNTLDGRKTDLAIDYSMYEQAYTILWRNQTLRTVKHAPTAFRIYTQLLREEWG